MIRSAHCLIILSCKSESIHKIETATPGQVSYYQQNKNEAYCKYVIQPKLEKFKKVFQDKLK